MLEYLFDSQNDRLSREMSRICHQNLISLTTVDILRLTWSVISACVVEIRIKTLAERERERGREGGRERKRENFQQTEWQKYPPGTCSRYLGILLFVVSHKAVWVRVRFSLFSQLYLLLTVLFLFDPQLCMRNDHFRLLGAGSVCEQFCLGLGFSDWHPVLRSCQSFYR